MKKTLLFKLVRPARKAGGDRYEATEEEFVIYVPQSISREGGQQPRTSLSITFEDSK